MLEYIINFFTSWFVYPGLSWNLILSGIGLAIVFGAIWLTCHWPPLFKQHWLWMVLVSSAILSLVAVSFIQIPLQIWVGQALRHFWSEGILIVWLPLVSIPQILLSGLVQEGAKMVPIAVWWWRRGRNIDPRLGLAIGAVAGADNAPGLITDTKHQPCERLPFQVGFITEGGKIFSQFIEIEIRAGFFKLHPFGLGRQGDQFAEFVLKFSWCHASVASA